MKTFISTILVTSSISSAAIAGNPASVVPAAIAPVAASVTDWSGTYAGGLVSLNSGDMDYFLPPNVHVVYPFDDGEAMYGVFVGYQHQMGSFVVGGEVAYQMGEFDQTEYHGYQIENFLDLKARLGFVAGDALIYATGGYSNGKYTERGLDNVVDYYIDFSGFNVGAGVDFKISERLFVGAEYLYRDTGGNYYDDDEYGEFQTQSIQLRAGLQF